jgi:hypothetical protein
MLRPAGRHAAPHRFGDVSITAIANAQRSLCRETSSPVIRARPVGRDRCRPGSAALERGGDAAGGFRQQVGHGAPLLNA